MAQVGDETKNDEGKAGLLSKSERDDMAKFLLNVTYPPAQRRAFDNELSERAQEGFELFHITGDVGGTPGGNLCGNCHRNALLGDTNTREPAWTPHLAWGLRPFPYSPKEG